MSPSQAFLWSCLVILTTIESSAFLINYHTNASVGHPDNDNYNIYSKIDALERTLQNLETTVQEKTTHSDTLMRQVLLTVTEMEVKMKTSDFQLQNMSLQIEKLENSSGNINIKYQLFMFSLFKKYAFSIRKYNISNLLFILCTYILMLVFLLVYQITFIIKTTFKTIDTAN